MFDQEKNNNEEKKDDYEHVVLSDIDDEDFKDNCGESDGVGLSDLSEPESIPSEKPSTNRTNSLPTHDQDKVIPETALEIPETLLEDVEGGVIPETELDNHLGVGSRRDTIVNENRKDEGPQIMDNNNNRSDHVEVEDRRASIVQGLDQILSKAKQVESKSQKRFIIDSSTV
eukprot:UN29857